MVQAAEPQGSCRPTSICRPLRVAAATLNNPRVVAIEDSLGPARPPTESSSLLPLRRLGQSCAAKAVQANSLFRRQGLWVEGSPGLLHGGHPVGGRLRHPSRRLYLLQRAPHARRSRPAAGSPCAQPVSADETPDPRPRRLHARIEPVRRQLVRAPPAPGALRRGCEIAGPLANILLVGQACGKPNLQGSTDHGPAGRRAGHLLIPGERTVAPGGFLAGPARQADYRKLRLSRSAQFPDCLDFQPFRRQRSSRTNPALPPE